jgi:hypothetical protein
MAPSIGGRYYADMTKREIKKIEKLMAVMKANMERASHLYRQLEVEVALMKGEPKRPKAKRIGHRKLRNTNRF